MTICATIVESFCDAARSARDGGWTKLTAAEIDSTPHAAGRGVLAGAFQVLEALARTLDGAGLSELARTTGLPKATTYRLLEQLLGVGAVQRDGDRYHVGNSLGRIGAAWQPQPRLRRAAQGPARTLARLTGAIVAVTVLDGGRHQTVNVVNDAVGLVPQYGVIDAFVARTAAGQVLLAAERDGHCPPGYSGVEWRKVRERLSRHGALAIDHQNLVSGIHCVAAPVPFGPGHTASISTMFVDRTPPPCVADLVLRASREITRTAVLNSDRSTERTDHCSAPPR